MITQDLYPRVAVPRRTIEVLFHAHRPRNTFLRPVSTKPATPWEVHRHKVLHHSTIAND